MEGAGWGPAKCRAVALRIKKVETHWCEAEVLNVCAMGPTRPAGLPVGQAGRCRGCSGGAARGGAGKTRAAAPSRGALAPRARRRLQVRARGPARPWPWPRACCCCCCCRRSSPPPPPPASPRRRVSGAARRGQVRESRLRAGAARGGSLGSCAAPRRPPSSSAWALPPLRRLHDPTCREGGTGGHLGISPRSRVVQKSCLESPKGGESQQEYVTKEKSHRF